MLVNMLAMMFSLAWYTNRGGSREARTEMEKEREKKKKRPIEAKYTRFVPLHFSVL